MTHQTAERPHKSTTHEEMFFHIIKPMGQYYNLKQVPTYKGATVFFRKEADGYWYAAAAYCSVKDQFNRRVGRSQARRRYFSKDNRLLDNAVTSQDKPTYELAERVVLGLMR